MYAVLPRLQAVFAAAHIEAFQEREAVEMCALLPWLMLSCLATRECHFTLCAQLAEQHTCTCTSLRIPSRVSPASKSMEGEIET